MGAGAALRRAAEELGFPIVVKPAAQGSALGFVRVDAADELSSAVMTAFNYGDRVVLERFVEGAELIVPVFGADLDALPAVEIRTASGVFDFQARVSPGAADYLCPAQIDDAVLKEVADVAHRAARQLGVTGFGRVDMRVGDDGPVVLDLKTCPGLTETSLVPLSVSEAGLTFEDFVAGVLATSS